MQVTNTWRSECTILEKARAEAEELAAIADQCAELADKEKRMFKEEVVSHRASQEEAWRNSEQH